MEIVFGVVIILIAYFVKGFSGFGPSLIIVPFFTLLYDPPSALVLAAFFDFFAGVIMTISVRNKIDWRFVISIFISLAAGTLLGSFFPGKMPVELLKKTIGIVILIFSLMILLQRNGTVKVLNPRRIRLKYPAAFLSGFLGGMVSMSGPPLVIYMKTMYDKDFFRTQLIGIFVLGTAWRSLLFLWHGLVLNISTASLIIFFLIMLLGLALGSRIHLQVQETTFNKIVALILLIPTVSLLGT
jgi:uncharacterized membrane protein YfcA